MFIPHSFANLGMPGSVQFGGDDAMASAAFGAAHPSNQFGEDWIRPYPSWIDRRSHVLTANINGLKLGWPKDPEDHVIPATRDLVMGLFDTKRSRNPHLDIFVFHLPPWGSSLRKLNEPILKNNTSINGITYAGGKAVQFDTGGHFYRGCLAQNTEVTLPGGTEVTAAKNTWLRFSKTYEFYERKKSTQPQYICEVTLAQQATIDGLSLAKGTVVGLDAKGHITSLILADTMRVPVTHHVGARGVIKFLELSADSEITYLDQPPKTVVKSALAVSYEGHRLAGKTRMLRSGAETWLTFAQEMLINRVTGAVITVQRP
ncbi:MAG TPA: hypothetical protein VJC18_03955 [bacterium]|nr:hypothetical protein [bacterium]